jgi:hypothetical protein
MDDMKLIMKGWRSFLHEGQARSSSDLLIEGSIDEGWYHPAIVALKGMSVMLSLGGEPVEVPVEKVIDAARTASLEIPKAEKRADFDNFIQSKAELMKIVDDYTSSDAEHVDLDGDGKEDEIQLKQKHDLSPHTIELLQQAMSTDHGYSW